MDPEMIKKPKRASLAFGRLMWSAAFRFPSSPSAQKATGRHWHLLPAEESKTLAQMSSALAERSQSGNFTPGHLSFG